MCPTFLKNPHRLYRKEKTQYYKTNTDEKADVTNILCTVNGIKKNITVGLRIHHALHSTESLTLKARIDLVPISVIFI